MKEKVMFDVEIFETIKNNASLYGFSKCKFLDICHDRKRSFG